MQKQLRLLFDAFSQSELFLQLFPQIILYLGSISLGFYLLSGMRLKFHKKWIFHNSRFSKLILY